ncbi:TIGR01777 family oxidoreductase [Hydrogenimonas thermophila]|uniref:TIGR01777 family oxidoreductase n=1 Tax=Hydrogenimonas thermophila TaxID=223786 RepID=UPI0029372D21|nr:TIGR01777 family oxidoreductase [Hydrogenimonas thermophila]WOE68744.1 TIGR01777 family oxidoreductase [Hydrogenimonas thermophila]WOE71254.1 TIGR01777 family oxidoreductase [Hydrogenimonas thermophila]
MKVVISGASGFVGSHLTKEFEKREWNITPLIRSDFKLSDSEFSKKFIGADVVIHLAGATINRRWSESYKKELYSSRIDTAKKIVKAMEIMEKKPKLFISTSAVGIYAGDGQYNEESAVYANDFLGSLAQDWEKAALEAKSLGVRTVIFRFGIVMGHGGGVLQQMVPMFKLGLGGTIGNGKQPFSWVHIDDQMRAYFYIIEHEDLEGIFNLMAPTPTTNYGLTKALGKALHRPTFFVIPKFILQLRFGSEAAEVFAGGQYVTPLRLPKAGFEFKFKTIEDALNDLFDRD